MQHAFHPLTDLNSVPNSFITIASNKYGHSHFIPKLKVMQAKYSMLNYVYWYDGNQKKQQ